MSRWRWEHRFLVDVPDHWKLDERDGVVEATAPDGLQVVQVSILRRSEVGPPSDELAASVAEYWVRSFNVDPPVTVRTLPDGAREATCGFDGDSQDGRSTWSFRALVDERLAVRASLAQMDAAIGAEDGLAVLAS